jgi:hypothetical protein
MASKTFVLDVVVLFGATSVTAQGSASSGATATTSGTISFTIPAATTTK